MLLTIFTRQLLFKFLKFGVVGFSGIFIDFGFTYLCKEKLHFHKYVSNSIGFLTACTSNYFLNRIWTFQSDNPNVAVEYSEFLLISAIGLAINTFLIYLLSDRFKINFYLSKLFAIGVVMIWNFFANLFVTFG